jgi:hypothetical protein
VLNTEGTLTALENEHKELEARHDELQHKYDNTVADNGELRTKIKPWNLKWMCYLALISMNQSLCLFTIMKRVGSLVLLSESSVRVANSNLYIVACMFAHLPSQLFAVLQFHNDNDRHSPYLHKKTFQ